jgi:hypothetical protein
MSEGLGPPPGERARRVLDKHAAALSRLPNVTGVGVGEDGGVAYIQVYVSGPPPALPRTLDGVEVRVRAIGELRPG